MKAAEPDSNPLSNKACGSPGARLSPGFRRVEPAALPADPDLARVVVAWPKLAANVKAAILALIGGPVE
jgi:hypothetical protein